MHAQKTERNPDGLGTDLLLDEVQRLQRDGFSAVNLGARRRAQTQLNLPGIHSGEDLRAQPTSRKHNHHRREHQVNSHRGPARPHQVAAQARIPLLKAAKTALGLSVARGRCLVAAQTQTDRMGTSVLDNR